MTGHRYVIELKGESAGLVVGERQGFRFYAAASHFAELEQRLVRSPGQAEDACRLLIARWPDAH
jgi:hypothetical protein